MMICTNLGLKFDYVNILILAMNVSFYKNDYFYILNHLTLNIIFLFIHSYSIPALLSTCHSTLHIVG